jgi:hypothetical protein
VLHRLLASYTHLRATAGCDWPAKFVRYVRRCKNPDLKEAQSMFTLTPPPPSRSSAPPPTRPKTGQPMLRVAAKLDENDGELVYGMGFDEEREDDLVIDGPASRC